MSDGWIRALVSLPFGLVVGSFLTVVVDRVPKKESVVSPRSRCPHCGAEIRSRDNIPVLSWLLLRGRCRSCRARIPLRYPLLEAGTAASFAGAAVVYPRVYIIAVLCAFSAVMLAVGAIDLELKIIPNRITYPAFPVFAVAIVLGWAVGQDLDPVRALVGAVAYGGAFLLIAFIAPRGLGMGDVKLTALIGLVMGSLGLRYVGVAAGAAILVGGLGGILALLAGRGRKSAIPFGPFLTAGALAAVFWGERVADWYLRSLT
jgi:leader peptidase (prepilin peptidase)/N-methyltransferase